MKVFFDHKETCLFSMELDPSDTILEMKQKIQQTHSLPVSKQTISFKGKIFFANQDSHTLQQYNIVDQSRLEINCYPPTRHDEYINQLLTQIQKPPSAFVHPGWPAMARSDEGQVLHQTEKSPPSAFVKPLPAMARSNEGQVLHQRKKSPLPPSGFFKPGWPAIPRSNEGQVLHQPKKPPLPPSAFFKPGLPAIARSTEGQVLHQTKKPPLPPSAFVNSGWPAIPRSNDGQVFHQTDQSLVPSLSSIEEFLGPARENQHEERKNRPRRRRPRYRNHVQEPSWNSQDLFPREPSSTSNTFGDLSFREYLPLSTHENISGQESSRGNDNSLDLFPREPSSTSNTSGDFFSFGEDLTLTAGLFTNTQSYRPPSTTQEFQMEQPSSLLSNSAEQRINDQARVGSSDQVVQTEVINIPESPESSSNKRAKNLRIMVLPYSRENKPVWKFWVEVNASENVEELKIELAKMQQRSQLDLPEGGYFFIHNNGVVDEKQSFRWNRIEQGALLQIFPGNFTEDNSTDT